jgi:hypothetical protein
MGIIVALIAAIVWLPIVISPFGVVSVTKFRFILFVFLDDHVFLEFMPLLGSVQTTNIIVSSKLSITVLPACIR